MSKQSNHPKANGHVQSNDAAAGKRSNGLVIPIQVSVIFFFLFFNPTLR